MFKNDKKILFMTRFIMVLKIEISSLQQLLKTCGKIFRIFVISMFNKMLKKKSYKFWRVIVKGRLQFSKWWCSYKKKTF